MQFTLPYAPLRAANAPASRLLAVWTSAVLHSYDDWLQFNYEPHPAIDL